jgi:hypothetical protein
MTGAAQTEIAIPALGLACLSIKPLRQFDQHGLSVMVVGSVSEFQTFFCLELELIWCAHGIASLIHQERMPQMVPCKNAIIGLAF